MGKYLDLDDVAAMSPKAQEELAELRRDQKRYELVRALTPQSFAALWDTNVRLGYKFDDLVDEAVAYNERRRAEPQSGGDS